MPLKINSQTRQRHFRHVVHPFLLKDAVAPLKPLQDLERIRQKLGPGPCRRCKPRVLHAGVDLSFLPNLGGRGGFFIPHFSSEHLRGGEGQASWASPQQGLPGFRLDPPKLAQLQSEGRG